MQGIKEDVHTNLFYFKYLSDFSSENTCKSIFNIRKWLQCHM